jgi:hypothetical protein
MTAADTPPVLLTMSQASAILGVNVSAVRRLVLRGAAQPVARAGENANSAILFSVDQLPDLQRALTADADTGPE